MSTRDHLSLVDFSCRGAVDEQLDLLRVARLTLQTRKLWLAGVATDRNARYF